MCCFVCFLLKKMDLTSLRSEMFDFNGVSMTHYFVDNWENVQNVQARPDDILIATYPKAGQSAIMNTVCKCFIAHRYVYKGNGGGRITFISLFHPGTTWVSNILDLLHFGQAFPDRQTSIPIYKRVPFLGVTAPFLQQGWIHIHTCLKKMYLIVSDCQAVSKLLN